VTVENAIFCDVMQSDSCKNYVSVERIAFIIRVKKISELGAATAVTCNLLIANVISR
jgi:hypothetical protein